MSDNKLFLYNGSLYEQLHELSIFFNVLYYDPLSYEFYYDSSISIQHEDWHKLIYMPNDMQVLANYIKIKGGN